VARKLPQLEKVLDARSIFSVAYGEVASSIYFALGIVVAHALGLAPVVLLAMGGIFLLVAASYAEGATMVEETGGAATFVRRAFNDLAGFVTGWALFLDYLIVIALSALVLPHYLAGALHIPALAHHPGDTLTSVGAIVLIALARLFRRARLYRFAIALAALDIVTQALLVVLGLALLVHPHRLASSVHLGTSPTWHGLAFALPVAMLAYTGLETVANLAEETLEPGVSLPRSLMCAIGAVVAVTTLTAIIGLSAFPVHNGHSALGEQQHWLKAPILGIVVALGPHVPHWADQVLRVFVGLSGAMILLLAASTSMSGCGRLAYSLGEHGQLPRVFGRLHRRTLVSPYAILAAAATSLGLLLFTTQMHNPVAALASLYSFGVLFAFTAAQLAVLRLRVTEPDRPRPYRVPFPVRIAGRELPLPTLVGGALTTAVWIIALATHPAARYGGPLWMLAGFAVYLLVRRGRGAGLLEHVVSADEQPLLQLQATSILVPMKLGEIGEEMLATAIKLAQERNGFVIALNVVLVPLDQALETPLADKEERARAALEEAALLGEEHGVRVTGLTVRARSIGNAIVDEAIERSVDLIVMGSAPRWRRQSSFFSPTVDYVLRKAPCEVLVVAFPQGVLEDTVDAPAPTATS
jgi:APA family basic amino acid/polyamine antiporter